MIVFEVSEHASRLEALLGHGIVPSGRYARLLVHGMTMMSDTRDEQISNYGVVRRATGDVLIAGLGMGMILIPILNKPEVRTVTVVEKHADVIALVKPQIEAHKPFSIPAKGKRGRDHFAALRVVHADIHDFAERGPWDAIYFDIWPDKSVDNLREIAKLKRRFARRLVRPNGWMAAWAEKELRAARRRGDWRV